MEITTMLNALIDSHGRIPGIFMEKRTRQHYRIRSWFAKRDKRQREEIARLEHALEAWKNYKPDDQDLLELAQQARSRDGSYTNGLAAQCVYIGGLEAYLRQKEAEIARLRAQLATAKKALEEISKGEGAFSRDPLTHASNTIENNKRIAQEALKKAGADGATV